MGKERRLRSELTQFCVFLRNVVVREKSNGQQEQQNFVQYVT